jgi:hypothetical protein
LFFKAGYAQNNVYAFFEYDIIDGMEDKFINGYEKDLRWHKSQGDDWSWPGWFVLNGNRRGRFIDAAPDHKWSDFDNWKINASENSRHNKIHWLPYVENPSGSYRIILDEFSRYKKDWFQNKFLQVYHIEIKNGQEEIFKRFLENYKSLLQSNLKENSFVWMRTISGGNIHEYYLFISFNKIEELELCETIFDFSDSQNEFRGNYNNSVFRNTSELWRYSERLSLIQSND